MSDCCSLRFKEADGGSVVVSDFTKDDGEYHGRFVWDSYKDTVSCEPEKQFATRRELDGSSTPVKKGAIQAGAKPILLVMK